MILLQFQLLHYMNFRMVWLHFQILKIKIFLNLDISPLRVEEVNIFGEIKAKYREKTGINAKSLKKNDLDFLIASTAMSQGFTLVSNDKIFEDISKYGFKLEYESWV